MNMSIKNTRILIELLIALILILIFSMSSCSKDTIDKISDTDIAKDLTSYTDIVSVSDVLRIEAAQTTAPMKNDNYINLTDSEIYELATLVYLEGRGESEKCQKAIASVVINRVTTSNYSLSEVIYKEGQFTPAKKIKRTTPNQKAIDCVQYVVMHGPTIPEYVTFFQAGDYFNWGPRYKDYICIDNTYFSYDTKLKERLENEAV